MSTRSDRAANKDHRKTIAIDARIRSTPLVLAPETASILINGASYIALAFSCQCREERKCADYPADFGCLYLGPGARGIVAKGNAREIDRSAATRGSERWFYPPWVSSHTLSCLCAPRTGTRAYAKMRMLARTPSSRDARPPSPRGSPRSRRW
jgi:hypothetical protein